MRNYICRPRPMPNCRIQFTAIVQEHHRLQQRVLTLLGQNQDVIHNLDFNGWDSLLSDSRHHLVTAFEAASNQLVGQAITLLPNQHNPDADMIDMTLPSDNPLDLATFRTIMSDPSHRGQGIMQKLITESYNLARTYNRSHFLGCITRTNTPSWSQFLKSGMVITAAGFDPSDNSTVYYAHRNDRNPLTIDNGSDTVIVHPDYPLNQLQDLFTCGYVGFAGERNFDNRYTGRLVMRRRSAI